MEFGNLLNCLEECPYFQLTFAITVQEFTLVTVRTIFKVKFQRLVRRKSKEF